MVQCAIEGCSSRSDTQPSAFTESAIHFHRLPTDALLRQKWIQAINKREVKASTRVCSLHFKKEKYYLTKRGLNKLTGGSVPEINLPYVEIKEDSSCDEEMRNVLPPEPNISYRSQPQQTSTKEITPEIGRTVHVLGSTNIKYVEDVKDDTTGSSSDEEISNVQPLEQNIIYQSQSQQNSTKVITPKIGTTVLGPTKCIKPGVQKHKVKTLLERKLLKEVRRLQEQGKKRMEAISCLIEQNRRLLDRNSFLEEELKNREKVASSIKLRIISESNC